MNLLYELDVFTAISIYFGPKLLDIRQSQQDRLERQSRINSQSLSRLAYAQEEFVSSENMIHKIHLMKNHLKSKFLKQGDLNYLIWNKIRKVLVKS